MKILSIIIPCYNEAKTIVPILAKISEISIPGWQVEVVIVDDGSKDGTRDILEKYRDRFKVIFHSENKGKGSAVKTGLESASGEYILIQDADLEYNPLEIPSLLRALENKDQKTCVVYGSRNLHHVKREGMYIPRAGVWFVTAEFNMLFGTKLTDLWTCYKLFPRSAIPFFVAGHFESELIFSARLIKNGYKIFEVPISHEPRTKKDGKKIRYRDGIKGIIVLLKEYFS